MLDALASEGALRIYVLELSSFSSRPPSAKRGGRDRAEHCEDHLDRYEGIELTLSEGADLQGSGIQVLNRDDAMSLGMRLPDAAM